MKLLISCALILGSSQVFAIDQNGNQMSDIWEYLFGATELTPDADEDGDGWSNKDESLAGTDPFLWNSRPHLEINKGLALRWETQAGKHYTIFQSNALTPGSWNSLTSIPADHSQQVEYLLDTTISSSQFFQLGIANRDTDLDGVSDWEERALGFDPAHPQSDRSIEPDQQRILSQLSQADVITVVSYDDQASETWPDPAVFSVRRTGGLQAVTVSFTLSGTATEGNDYPSSGSSITLALGQKEAFIPITALPDSDSESLETVIITLSAGPDYTLGDRTSSTVTLTDGPSSKEAARLLIQAAFGPDQDSPDDSDQIPENVETVMNLGIEGWIDDQLTRPIGRIQPFVEWAEEQPNSLSLYNDNKKNAWWGRAMELPKLRPDASVAEEQLSDPLRQRMGFALSQIFVVSSKLEDLGGAHLGMANYYDMLLEHSFGNFRDLLFDVSMHPCMGIYLSSLGNRKPDPINNTFPDENYAREIMQLFSIGLWELNQDGSQKLDNGNPIPTYNNEDITNFARVFTGIAFGGSNTSFGLWPRDFTQPMGTWDEQHDLDPKVLLNGVTTPAHSASAGRTGTATLADINAAIDNLFNHNNVGPFIGRLLIQRLVTSNPSPEYIGRVSAVFANDGSNVRGNMAAVLKAILMDPEARDPSYMESPTHGKLREPFLRCVNLARAFNAASEEGWYYLDAFELDHAQEIFESPSVFNFYLPNYSPPGPLAENGLVAPEFQIVNATTTVTSQNYYRQAISGSFHRWGVGYPGRGVVANLDQEMLLNVPDIAVTQNNPTVDALAPEPLIRRLDLVLTGGTLSSESYQIISTALRRIGPGSGWRWHHARLDLAIILVMNSAEFSIQR